MLRKSHVVVFTTVFLPFAASSCSSKSADNDSPSAFADLAVLVGNVENLEGAPNLYEFAFSNASDTTVTRRGDLPSTPQVIRLTALPVGDGVTVSARLYKDQFLDSKVTHVCESEEPLQLVAGQESTATLSCVPVDNSVGSRRVTVFMKMARVVATLNDGNAQPLIDARLAAPALLFSQMDTSGRRISLKMSPKGTVFHIGGEVSYVNETPHSALLASLLAGESAAFDILGGKLAQALPTSIMLSLEGTPVLYEMDGATRLALTVSATSGDERLSVQGTLLEEDSAAREFTLVSYNVENLFDQTDDERNQSYGDYRLMPNPAGQWSNYGETSELSGTPRTYTDIKALGIRETLLGIDPSGPEIVALTEIESQASIDTLLGHIRDLGYVEGAFAGFIPGRGETSVGGAIITKFPIRTKALVAVAAPPPAPGQTAEEPRPIFKVTLDAAGKDFVVYINHWKSKSGPESQRILYAEALEQDIVRETLSKGRFDYAIVGDLNSNYNEAVTLEDGHNDTGGRTGINHVLRAQGDELAALRQSAPVKYNLHYELPREARQTAYHDGFGWSSMDHIVVGPGVYDFKGISYVDNSFYPLSAALPRVRFLFNDDGTTNRWKAVRETPLFTRHSAGGYSDHVPIVARFTVNRVERQGTMRLVEPSRRDATDPVIP